ncbi:hypothetical protein Tco_1383591, partial [Tanacetum coccineum]
MIGCDRWHAIQRMELMLESKANIEGPGLEISNAPQDNSPVTIPRRRNRRRAPNIVGTIVEVAPMADNRTMEELLQAPTEGYGE